MRGARRTALLTFALLFSRLALAQDAAPQPPQVPAPVQHDLYEDALQSLAEGRKNDASETLMRLVKEEPEHAGAWLEVALIQCGLGHTEEAERLFATVETRFNPPPGILDIIAEARKQGCSRWKPATVTSFTLGRGIDQNVNQGASNPSYIVERDGGQIELPLAADFLPKQDQYTVLSAEYLRDLTPNGSLGFAQFQGRRYDHLRQYDSASLFMGVETPYRFGGWTLRTTGMFGMISLGGQYYQRQLQLQARVGPPLVLPYSTQFNVLAGVTHTQYLTLTNFDSNAYELRGQLTRRTDKLYTSASLSYLDDRARAERPGGGRKGWLANLVARRPLGNALTGELAYTRQAWNSDSAYSPGLIDQLRAQETHVLRGTMVYQLKKNQALQLEARLVRNNENISIFQYNNKQLQLSWQWQGP
jgi:hypothetical protein